jgi:hypothetical protein
LYIKIKNWYFGINTGSEGAIMMKTIQIGKVNKIIHVWGEAGKKFSIFLTNHILDQNFIVWWKNLNKKFNIIGKILLAMPDEIPALMDQYFIWINKKLIYFKKYHDQIELNKKELKEILSFSCDSHTLFVHIHPFSDGNGRLAWIISGFYLF